MGYLLKTHLDGNEHEGKDVENVGQAQPVVLELHSTTGVDQILRLALVVVPETGIRSTEIANETYLYHWALGNVYFIFLDTSTYGIYNIPEEGKALQNVCGTGHLH